MQTRTVPDVLPAIDRVNRRAYQHRGTLRQYGNAEGWLEPGEQRAIAHVASSVRGLPILDIGAGGGRMSAVLRQVSPAYLGIDYTPAMVTLARKRFPESVFLEMDARSLGFPDQSFGLAVFTYNGIDSVDLIGRRQVLREVFRVLYPGGYFVFSALNRRHAATAGHWPDWTVFSDAGRSPVHWLRSTARLALGGINRLRYARMLRTGEDIAVGQISAHNFGLVTLFVAVPQQVQQLQLAGFDVEAIFAPDGTLAQVERALDYAAPWYYYVARKK